MKATVWVMEALCGSVGLGRAGIDADIPERPVGGAAIVAQQPLQRESAAFGHRARALILRVSDELDAQGAQFFLCATCQGADGFADVALAKLRGAAPVAHFKFRYLPVWPMQAGASDQEGRAALEDEVRQSLRAMKFEYAVRQ